MVWHCNFLVKEYQAKSCVVEIDHWCQFHQHFTRDLFANILLPKNYESKCNRKAAQSTFVQKMHTQNVEIDHRLAKLSTKDAMQKIHA